MVGPIPRLNVEFPAICTPGTGPKTTLFHFGLRRKLDPQAEAGDDVERPQVVAAE